jgi:hypothetical protein
VTRSEYQSASLSIVRSTFTIRFKSKQKSNPANETHLDADDVPITLRVYVNDGVNENALRYMIIEIAETLKIVVDGNAG